MLGLEKEGECADLWLDYLVIRTFNATLLRSSKEYLLSETLLAIQGIVVRDISNPK